MIYSGDRRRFVIRLLGAVGVFATGAFKSSDGAAPVTKVVYKGGAMKLPPVQGEGTVSLEQAIKQRRTVRSFGRQPLDLYQLTRLLWAAQGTTADRGLKRAAPSAGALYPMDVYAAVGRGGVDAIEAGVYHYEPGRHRLSYASGGDIREPVARACLSQRWMATAPVSVVITAEYRRITAKYGKRGVRYAMIEAGHIGQNLFLQAEALGLKAGIVGAFDDKRLNQVMNIPIAHEPLLVMPVGYQG